MKKKRFKRVNISKLTNFSFLPSIFSLLSLFAGYLALIQIFNGKFYNAVFLVMASVVLDGFDGTIARLTKTESNFGTQLDSLVDAIVFGLVSSAMVYKWGFQGEFSQFGKVIGFIFLSAGIIRLARFNVLKDSGAIPMNTFVGLPIPAGALSICSVVLVFKDPINSFSGVILYAIFVIMISYLMISNIKYKTLKRIDSKKGLQILFLFAIVVALLIMYPSNTLPVMISFYLISPIFFYLSSKMKKKVNLTGRRTDSSSEEADSKVYEE
ncbi:MAG: CDP-diacylglycerol--serine O-phosphatidyltransferase [Acidobacteriota bacterium]